jgi:hypothetical protein
MRHDMNEAERPNDGRINVNKSDDMDYRTHELKVPSQTLLQAVQMVGPKCMHIFKG